jgi:hypothetical protein
MKKIVFTMIMLVMLTNSAMGNSPSTTLKPAGVFIGYDYYIDPGRAGYDIIEGDRYDFGLGGYADFSTIYLGYKAKIKQFDIYAELILSLYIAPPPFDIGAFWRGRIGTNYNFFLGIGKLSLGFETILRFNSFDRVALNFIIGLDADSYGAAIKIINKIDSSFTIERIEFSGFFYLPNIIFDIPVGLGLAIGIPIDSSSDIGLTIIPEMCFGWNYDGKGTAKAYFQFPITERGAGVSMGFRISIDPTKW